MAGVTMHARRRGRVAGKAGATAGGLAGAAALALLGGCTSDDMAMFADAMTVAADEMSVTLAAVPPYGCDYNVNDALVCDDTGDGFADRYGDPAFDFDPYAVSYVVPVTPPVRVNGRGKAFEYDGGCDCWRREPSLDEAPPYRDDNGHGHGRRHDGWDD